MQTRTSNLSEDSSCASKHSIQIGGKASISGSKGGGAGASELLLQEWQGQGLKAVNPLRPSDIYMCQ